jgi:hypothetical protein
MSSKLSIRNTMCKYRKSAGRVTPRIFRIRNTLIHARHPTELVLKKIFIESIY